MSLLRALGAVSGGMIGIRRGDQAKSDWSHIKPWHIAVAAITMVALFVITLVSLVSFIAG